MDGETIRLMATAASAVVAGFGGAWMAGRYNSKNTRATIEAARVQSELDRQQEHTRWLRSRKVQCYADFLSQSHQLHMTMATLHEGDPLKMSRLAEVADTASNELLLIAPRYVYDAAVEVMRHVDPVMRASRPNADSRARNAEYDAATRAFIEKCTTLERLIRHDLGVEELVEETA